MGRNTVYAGIILGLSGVFLFAVGLYYPSVFIEDGPVEMAGAMLFFATVLAAIHCLFVGRRQCGRLERLVTVLLIPASLVLALSEISFGARVGLLSPPQMYGGGEFDGGHDALILLLRLMRDGQIAGWIFLAVAAFLGLLGWAAYRWRNALRELWAEVISNPLILGVAISGALVAMAVILDLKSQLHLSLIEETLELLSAALLVITVGYRSITFRREGWQSKLENPSGRLA